MKEKKINKTKRHINKTQGTFSKTKKNIGVVCSPRFLGIENKYKKTFKKNIERSYEEMHKILLHAFKIPFSPSKITPQSDYYTYINYRWIQDAAKKYASKKTKNRYFVEVDIFRLAQNKVYGELFELVKKYLDTEHSKKRNAINNVYKSLLKLESSTIKTHFKEMDTLYKQYVEKDNMWGLMANLNENEIISWGAPISWSVSEDPNNINAPKLSLYDYLLYLGDYGQTPKYIKYKKSVVTHYINYINKIFDKCLGKGHGLEGKHVFDVEVELLNEMGCDNIKTEDPDGYNKVYAEEAMEKYGFDWIQFSKLLGYKAPPKYFICTSVNYLKCICKNLKDNWKTPKWKSYIYYIIMRQMIRFDRSLIHIYYDFNAKFIEGQPDPFPQNFYPIFGLSYTFNTFLTDQYVGAYSNVEHLNYIENMANDLLTVFKRIMKRNTWLTPKTKAYAIKKLDHLELVIGKPAKMREDPLLDYSPDDAWYNMSLISKWKKEKYIKLEGKAVIDIPLIDWKQFKLIGTQSYVVNAYYEMNKNKIFIPMAIMQKPFVNLDQRGFEFNLARMGYTLGHEMSHALDNSGSKYDYKGNLHDWWAPEDKKKYNVIVKDIIKQYETFASYDGIKFDAAITVGEDMADISGIAICQEYLCDYHEINNVVMPVRQLSLKEFYVHYASHQRQHIYKRAELAQLGTNPHPLDKYRTNCVLARLELFKEMNNIKKGDNMWWETNNINTTIWN